MVGNHLVPGWWINFRRSGDVGPPTLELRQHPSDQAQNINLIVINSGRESHHFGYQRWHAVCGAWEQNPALLHPATDGLRSGGLVAA